VEFDVHVVVSVWYECNTCVFWG